MVDSCIRLTLDLRQTSVSTIVQAKRSDTGRVLRIALADDGVPYTIEKDCYAVFTAKKPDKTVLLNPCTVENNEVVYEFNGQTCAVTGRMPAEIRLYGTDEKLITTASFYLDVQDTVYHLDDIVSQDFMDGMDNLILDTIAVKDEVEKLIDDIKDLVADGIEIQVDETLRLENGVLSVNTTDLMEQDNTLPITSAGVYATVGNIEALLKTI